MGNKSRPRSPLGLYKQLVFPLLAAAGFRGTTASSSLKLPRSHYWAQASGKGAVLKVRITGSENGQGQQTFLELELSDLSTSSQEQTVEKIAGRVRRLLRRIDKRRLSTRVAKASSLKEALEALLLRLCKTHGTSSVKHIEAKGRGFIVNVQGAAHAFDRSALFSGISSLLGSGVFPAHRLPGYSLQEAETLHYIGQLAELDKEEARALYLQIYSPYALDDMKLFPKPMYATTYLDPRSGSEF